MCGIKFFFPDSPPPDGLCIDCHLSLCQEGIDGGCPRCHNTLNNILRWISGEEKEK